VKTGRACEKLVQKLFSDSDYESILWIYHFGMRRERKRREVGCGSSAILYGEASRWFRKPNKRGVGSR
jgi:hypothetical protein